MTASVKDIVNSLNLDAPFNLAESWDNVGLLIGNPEQKVTSILIGLDPTNTLIDEALAIGANTLITHHPVIFKPLPSINTADPSGKLIEKALSNKISIISCHTNLDSATDGVSDILAKSLGLTELRPLLPNKNDTSSSTGMGRVGIFTSPVPRDLFIDQVLKGLNMDSVQVAGEIPELIKTVAVCGGSGSDLAAAARTSGADAYLSAEIKHSTAIWATENNFCIIDGTHYGTEQPSVHLLATKLTQACDALGWNIEIKQTQTETHPFVSINKKHRNNK